MKKIMKLWYSLCAWAYNKSKEAGILIVVVMMGSCSNASRDNQDIIVIDGCEYLQNSGIGMNNYNLTHKGNCNNPIHKLVIRDTMWLPSENHSQIP